MKEQIYWLESWIFFYPFIEPLEKNSDEKLRKRRYNIWQNNRENPEAGRTDILRKSAKEIQERQAD